MGSVSDKLIYLNGTKSKLKDSINLTGTGITDNDTFRSYASRLKNGYIDIINNGIDILYSNFPKVSKIGSNLSLTPTYAAPMRNLPLGNTLQDGTPTPDNPVEVQSATGLQKVNICGKNLCSNAIYFSTGAVYLYFNPKTINRTFTISLISDVSVKGATFYMFGGKSNLGEIADSTIDLIANQKVTKTITLGNTMYENIQNYDICNISIYKYNAAHDTSKVVGEPQIENGSSYTTYEPYKCDTYEVNLDPNIYDFNYTNNGYIYAQNCNVSLFNKIYSLEATASDAYVWLIQTTNQSYNPNSGKLYEIKSDSYTITLNSDFNKNYIAFYNENKVCLGRTQYTTNEFTITPPSNAKYFAVRFGISDSIAGTIYKTSVKIVETSKVNFTPIELNEIDEHQDRIYKDNGKWYVEKNTRKLELAIKDMNNGEQFPGWNSQIQLKKDWPNTNTQWLFRMGIVYLSNIAVELGSNYESVGINTNGSGILYLNPNYWNLTQAQWKENYPNLVFSMVYGLKTPEITEITNTELINQLEELYTALSHDDTTNIFITSENLPMKLNASALKNEI